MWIINARTIQVEFVVSERDASPYAIISHTWGEPQNEITFDDIKHWHSRDLYDSKRPGWEKVAQACAKALEYNYEYMWIDTCCIDKSSSAELQESTNSMFACYSKSAICFAYLSDVESSHTSERQHDEQFQRSRWFTRGWTLQELLAPTKVDYFNCSWQKVGDKIELCDLIPHITGIRRLYLRGGDKAASQTATVAEWMSWAAKKKYHEA
ncbi:heterokaryon incompatibility protein-domain-containing protein [Penicillium malachiteum]|uniref:heterokaryon incompatibility protein-domain-containing protein n=1 Tax=Penicillium malachiteum TaxID=1324776 RepID=UPI002547734E|nr:heterokaryon incompatibility protein-domain-containing protein [Penicillium malachiteum]KAJ5731400.1 heterokaryon incompatibility protein-domain-containing protein [Penicillium malachiteum]